MKGSIYKALPFVGPNLVGFLCFTIGPIFATGLLSFFAWDLFGTPEFKGLANYRELLSFQLSTGNEAIATGCFIAGLVLAMVGGTVKLFAPENRIGDRILGLALGAVGVALGWVWATGVPQNPKFWQSLWNTLFLLIGLPVGMFGSLFLAVLLNEKIFGNQFFRLVYFLPSVVGGVGVYLLWKWIFNPDIGPVNLLLSGLPGVTGPGWFESSQWAKPALMIMSLWGSVGGTNMILYLAALQSIDPGLYEAADIDGAGRIQKFWQITVPMVSSTTVFIFIMGIISGFQGGFDAAYVITRGGPAGATTTMNYFIYESAFKHLEFGVASAASMFLFALVLAMSWVNWKWTSSRVHYT